jgi:hypothetical protein
LPPDALKEKLKLWKTQLKRSVLTYFPSFHSYCDSIFNVTFHILFIDKLLKKFEKRFEDSEYMKFTMSFTTNLFQERDIIESAELTSSAFKENVTELKF